MMSSDSAKTSLVSGVFSLALAVILGAFGAHALKNIVSEKYLVTYQTGITYQFYHSFSLIILGLIKQQFSQIKIQHTYWCYLLGILFFSFNCYFYTIFNMKLFAMLVPIGGSLFIVGHLLLCIQLFKRIK